ncbi:hypothetical protein C8J56DRAFT_716123, partial [Mycena floridula]
QERDQLLARAVVLYQAEQDRPGPEKKKGLRPICRELEKTFFQDTGRSITLNHNTLRNLINGHQPRSAVNAERGWLRKEEVEAVIAYTQEIADWGHGFSHRRLKEHVDEILRARLGKNFPETGVGIQWTQRFVEKYSDRL